MHREHCGLSPAERPDGSGWSAPPATARPAPAGHPSAAAHSGSRHCPVLRQQAFQIVEHQQHRRARPSRAVNRGRNNFSSSARATTWTILMSGSCCSRAKREIAQCERDLSPLIRRFEVNKILETAPPPHDATPVPPRRRSCRRPPCRETARPHSRASSASAALASVSSPGCARRNACAPSPAAA